VSARQAGGAARVIAALNDVAARAAATRVRAVRDQQSRAASCVVAASATIGSRRFLPDPPG